MADEGDPNARPGTVGSTKKGVVDTVLSLFAEVHPGEGLSALILMANVLLLLVAYYVLKTVREPLILASGGAQLKAYATAAQAVLLMGFVPLYAALTKRLKRMQLITATLVFYAGVFVTFWVLARMNVPYLGFAFFLVLGIFSLSVIAQFWSLANDLYTQEQGKRLFAILGVGASLGAVVGSYVAKKLVKPLGPFQMMLVAAAILGVCLLLSWVANTREEKRKSQAATAATKDDEPIGGKNGFSLILEDRYLLMIAGVILLLNLVNTTGELILSINIEEAAKASVENFDALDAAAKKKVIEEFSGVWYGDFFTWVNAIGAITQLFFVSRIFKYLGLRIALFSLPLIGLFTYGVMAFVPIFSLVRIGKIAENSCDYSLYNTTKQALWLPTSREQKYNAKTAIDTFIVRAGDFVSGLVVAVGKGWGFGAKTFALVNLVIIGVWIFLVVVIGRENAKRTDPAAGK
ncbi:MAG: MFS transporter [Deltaproteobacteria bacterium]|nr:MFS transporter [Deltaproteobacteria bacterium]